MQRKIQYNHNILASHLLQDLYHMISLSLSFLEDITEQKCHRATKSNLIAI